MLVQLVSLDVSLVDEIEDLKKKVKNNWDRNNFTLKNIKN